MNSNANNRSIALSGLSRRWIVTAAIIAIGIGSFWIVAWLTGAAAQWSASKMITVKTNMALGQLLAGIALLFLARPYGHDWQRRAGVLLGLIVLAIGALTLGEHLLKRDLGIDQLIATELPGAPATAAPNRMGIPGSTSLILVGAGLIALARRRWKVAQYLGLAICMVNLVPAIGFIYGINEFYTNTRLTSVAWPTVLVMMALGTGLIVSSTDEGVVAVLLRDDPGGVLLRRMLPAAVLVLLVVGYLRVLGQYRGLYDTATGTGLLVIMLIVVFSVMLWRSAISLSKSSEEIGRSRALLAEAEKLSHTGAWEWDLKSDQWTFSDEWLAIHGCDKRTLTPEELLQISYADDRGIIERAFQDVRNGTKSYDIEHRIIRQNDGAVRVVRARGNYVRSDDGRVVRVYGFAQDITEQKHAEEALRDSEAQLRTMLENITEGVIVADMNGELIHWNRTALQMHGYSSIEECRRLLPEFTDTFEAHEMDGTTIPIENWPMSRIIRGEQLRNWELYIKRVDQGWERIWSYGGSIVRDDNGKPLLALLSVVDITERKQVEAQVNELNSELEQRVEERTAELQASNKELRTLSYSIMHDLRTPLRAIGGFSDALLKHYSDNLDDRGQDYLRRTVAATQKMSRIIDDIHDLLRATRADVTRQRVDVSAMARDILDTFRLSQPERRAEVTIEPDITANADPNLLRAALDHLLGNAWKFTGSRDMARIEVAAIERDGERVYLIRDNGVGFNPAYANKLFMPFQRLHSESDFPGTGIGLALVERILRRHGGRIWAEGEVDKGASFYFTLGETDR